MSSIDGLLTHVRGRVQHPPARQGPQPRLRTAIVTCMDARIDPVSLFGLTRGDANVIRNAGASRHLPGMRLGAVHDLDRAVAETVEALRRCPFLTYRDGIHGFVYELDSDTARPVAGGEVHGSDAILARPMTGLEMLPGDVLNLKRARRR